MTLAKKCLLFCLVPTPAQESRIEELESDLKDRDEEIKSLKDTSSQLKAVNGEDSDIVKVILCSEKSSKKLGGNT